jgi:O-antigen ligase
MSGGYGRVFGDPRFAVGSDDIYPNKYLRPDWLNRQMGGRAGARKAATLSLSLLFPVVVLLMLTVTIRHEDNDGSFDLQLGVRLAGYLMAALSVLLALGTRKMRIDWLIFAWALVPIGIALTALYAPEPSLSLAAGMAHLALLLFAWRLVNLHGQPSVALALVLTGAAVCLLSVLVFYAFPDIGRSTPDLLSGDTGGRMRGVTAQPNSLGTVSALTILLAIMHFRAFTLLQRIFAIGAIGLAAFCLVYCESRTSIAAMLACLLLWRLCRANAAFNLFAVVALALLAAVLVAFIPDIAVHFTRNGTGSDELASLNGRSWIWDVAIENIRTHPIFGQGYGASRLILPNDERLFSAALNAHNVYLELLFSGGVVLFALYFFSVAISIVRSVTRRRIEALIALLFFLIVGAAEATPYGGLPLFPAFVFYIAVSLCLARSPREFQATPVMANRRPAFAGPRQRPAGR